MKKLFIRFNNKSINKIKLYGDCFSCWSNDELLSMDHHIFDSIISFNNKPCYIKLSGYFEQSIFLTDRVSIEFYPINFDNKELSDKIYNNSSVNNSHINIEYMIQVKIRAYNQLLPEDNTPYLINLLTTAKDFKYELIEFFKP